MDPIAFGPGSGWVTYYPLTPEDSATRPELERCACEHCYQDDQAETEGGEG